MSIEKDKVVSMNYVLKDDQGNVIDQSQDGQFAYLHGANNIIPGLEEALEGKNTGDEITVSIEPAKAYGEHNPEAVQRVPRSQFPADIEIQPGMQFQTQAPNGQIAVVTVAGVEGDEVLLDTNHPLAGKTLNFEVTITDVRDATEEEKAHGHVHGAGGH